jgi:hypothetical protein
MAGLELVSEGKVPNAPLTGISVGHGWLLGGAQGGPFVVASRWVERTPGGGSARKGTRYRGKGSRRYTGCFARNSPMDSEETTG